MKLIAGLGNPGRRYQRTRHNVGFDVIDRLAQRYEVTFKRRGSDALLAVQRESAVLLLKPLTYMNVSGSAVASVVEDYGIALQDLLIVVDDVNLPLGRIRVRAHGSAGGHNGLRSIAAELGSFGFPRLRVGVGRGELDQDLSDHVLMRFDAHEREIIAEALDRAVEAAELFVRGNIEEVMRAFNRPASSP